MDEKKGTITITASIAIYSQGNSNYSQEQLNDAAKAIESAIEGAWNGMFVGEDGITYMVKTDVDVQAYVKKEDAFNTNPDVQNVIGISKGWAIPRKAMSNVDERSFFRGDSGPDTGTWNYDRVMSGRGAAHEFTHVIGAGDTRDRSMVAYSAGSFQTPIDRYGNATGSDYRHALRGPIDVHHQACRQWERHPYAELGRGPQRILGRESSHTSTQVVVNRQFHR